MQQAAQPAEPWEGVRDATAEGNVCAQLPMFPVPPGFVGGEDCLFINVYTPSLEGEFLPVMVWSNSGGFVHGSGNTDMSGPEFLVEKDVVVVTFNYRSGPLGFLCLNTPEVPGNAGMKDQVLALKWVKENIGSFGGNSGNITVFGESAGGASCSLLTLSPLSKDLMGKAILQSGTGLNWFALVQNDPLDNARELSKSLGGDSNDIEDVYNFLQTVPVKDLVEASARLRTADAMKFAPVIEKEFSGVEAFLTEHPINILTSGRGAKIPIMIGRAAEESAINLAANFTIDDDLRNFIPKAFNIGHNSEKAVDLAGELKKFYFHDAHIGMDSLHQYLKLLSDRDFAVDIHRYVQILTQTSNQAVYYYRFSYVGALNILRKILDSFGIKHAGHIDELGYLFSMAILSDVEASPSDLKTREAMVQMWTNFAKTGNPTPDENQILTITWLPVTKEHEYYLDIDKELTLATNLDHDRMQFWEDWYSKYFKVWNTPASPVKVDVEENNAEGSPVNAHFEYAQGDDSQNDSGITDEADGPESPKAEVSEEIDTSDVSVDVEKSEAVPDVEKAQVQELEVKNESVEDTIANGKESIENVEQTNGSVETTNGNAEVTNGTAQREEEDRKEEQEVIQKIENVIINEEKKIEKLSQKHNDVKVTNGGAKDIIRANDPPEDDLPKNIGVNKFVNFFESLGGKKK